MNYHLSPQAESSLEEATLATTHKSLWATVGLLATFALGVGSGLGQGRPPGQGAVHTLLMVLNSACLGIFFLYLDLPRRPRERAVVVGLGGLIELALAPWRYHTYGPIAATTSVGVGWGSLGLVAMLLRLAWARGEERRRVVCYLWVAPLLPLAYLALCFLQLVAIEAHPLVRDQFAYRLDSSLGFSPNQVVTDFVRSWGLEDLVYTTYHHLSALMLLGVVFSLRSRTVYFDLVACYCISGLIGSTLYNLYPLVGAVGLQPGDLPGPYPPAWIPGAAVAPRNGMPSMHTTWILMVYLCFRRHPVKGVRVFGLAFTLLTLLAVFPMGNHYLLDVVVAFPFLLGNLGLSSRALWVSGRIRLAAILLGFGLTALCLGALNLAWEPLYHHPYLLALGEGLVVALSVGAEEWMYRHSRR